jgi:hypothetical protein
VVTVRELKARLSLADTTFTMGMSKAASATRRLQTNLGLAATNLVTFEAVLKNTNLGNLQQLLAIGNKKLAITFSLDWKAMRNDINDFINAHGKRGNLNAFKDLQLSLDWKYLRDQINEFVENKGAKDKRMKEFNKVQMDAVLGGGATEMLDVLKEVSRKLDNLDTIKMHTDALRTQVPIGIDELIEATEANAPLAAITGAFK